MKTALQPERTVNSGSSIHAHSAKIPGQFSFTDIDTLDICDKEAVRNMSWKMMSNMS